MTKFKIGDTVFLNIPGHIWDKQQFGIIKEWSYFHAGYLRKAYSLSFGTRLVDATEDEIMPAQLDLEDFADFMIPPQLSPDYQDKEDECAHGNVVKSSAAGKEFWYCKNCKEEVIQIYNGTFRKL